MSALGTRDRNGSSVPPPTHRSFYAAAKNSGLWNRWMAAF